MFILKAMRNFMTAIQAFQKFPLQHNNFVWVFRSWNIQESAN